MKYIVLSIFFLSTLHLNAQKMSKKELKNFNKAVISNFNASKTHFKDQIDLANRDEVLGMPSSKIPLPNCKRHYFDAAVYGMTYIYSFENDDDAKEFFGSILKSVKSKMPQNTTLVSEDAYLKIMGIGNEGDSPTVESSLEDNTIVIAFNPPLDVSLPMDW